VTGTIFATSAFRPFGREIPARMGLSLKTSEEWWKVHKDEWEAATGAGVPGAVQPAAARPLPPPTKSSGPSPYLLVGGILVVAAGAAAAIFFSKKR
jgi:hypothetical protein